VQIRRNSRGEAQFALRGSGDARQVAVILDGVPLTLGWDHRVDLSVIPVSSSRAITLVRGVPSLLYGPNVLGGVLEIGLGHAGTAAAPALSGAMGFDHVGGWSAAAAGTAPTELSAGNLVVRAGAGFRSREGVPLAAGIVDAGSVREEGPFTVPVRANSDMRQVDGHLSLVFHGNPEHNERGAWAAASATAFRSERGVPPELHVASPRLWRYPGQDRLIMVVAAGSPVGRSPFGGVGDVELGVGLDVGATEIESFSSLAYDEVIAREFGNDRTTTLRMHADQTLGARGHLRAAITFADVIHDERLEPGAEARYRQNIWSAGAELRMTAAQRALAGMRLSLSAAIDGANTPDSGDKPPLDAMTAAAFRAGLTGALLDGRVIAHAAVLRRSRFPSLRELYSGALGRFEPNPGLRPETLLGMEAGVGAQVQDIEVQVVAFHHDLSDAIVRIRTPAGRFQRTNRDEVRSTGVEIVAGTRIGRASVSGDVTAQQVRLRHPSADGAIAEYEPSILAGILARVPVGAAMTGSAALRHVGAQQCLNPDSATAVRLAPTNVANAELARDWVVGALRNSRLTTSLAVDNAGDARVYDQCGLPAPGRIFRLEFRIR
jgi:iron complex outermembrane recepter protein